jgi:hypothetical protein
MIDLLKSVDNWFLLLAIILLGGWFVWSLRNIFNELKESIRSLNETMNKLFEADKGFEHRLSHLEGEHKARACWPVNKSV